MGTIFTLKDGKHSLRFVVDGEDLYCPANITDRSFARIALSTFIPEETSAVQALLQHTNQNWYEDGFDKMIITGEDKEVICSWHNVNIIHTHVYGHECIEFEALRKDVKWKRDNDNSISTISRR